MRLLAALTSLGALLTAAIVHAQNDPATARAHLVEGAELRKQGKCAEAIPHFTESVVVMPEPTSTGSSAASNAPPQTLAPTSASSKTTRAPLATPRGVPGTTRLKATDDPYAP